MECLSWKNINMAASLAILIPAGSCVLCHTPLSHYCLSASSSVTCGFSACALTPPLWENYLHGQIQLGVSRKNMSSCYLLCFLQRIWDNMCFHVYFSWMQGPTGYPGSEPDSGIETPPWPSCCHTVNTAETRDYSAAVTQTHTLICVDRVTLHVRQTSLTPTPRLEEHIPPKYAALLLR